MTYQLFVKGNRRVEKKRLRWLAAARILRRSHLDGDGPTREMRADERRAWEGYHNAAHHFQKSCCRSGRNYLPAESV